MSNEQPNDENEAFNLSQSDPRYFPLWDPRWLKYIAALAFAVAAAAAITIPPSST